MEKLQTIESAFFTDPLELGEEIMELGFEIEYVDSEMVEVVSVDEKEARYLINLITAGSTISVSSVEEL